MQLSCHCHESSHMNISPTTMNRAMRKLVLVGKLENRANIEKLGTNERPYETSKMCKVCMLDSRVDLPSQDQADELVSHVETNCEYQPNLVSHGDRNFVVMFCGKS